MHRIKELIELILNDKKIQKKVYRDEPIIRPASQMNNYTPSEIYDMRRLSKKYYDYRECFYRQALFMANYEDDFMENHNDDYNNYGNLVKYYPTYDKFTDTELRVYFSWRTKYRKGEVRNVSLSFVYLHAYELLHLIGAASETEAFFKLKKLAADYPAINKYTQRWLIDFAVYYNLDKLIISDCFDMEYDNMRLILRDYQKADLENFFTAFSYFSSYNISRSAFFKQYPEDLKIILYRVYSKVCETFEKRSKTRTYFDKLFGQIEEHYYQMFTAAVFYDTKKYVNYEYVIDETHSYSCRNSVWKYNGYYGSPEKKRELGDIAKTIDSAMRERYGFKKQIQPGNTAKYTQKIIETTIDDFLFEKKEREKNVPPEIKLDLTKLDNIRRTSDVIRDKLITEDEIEEEPIREIPDDITSAEVNDKTNDTCILDEIEQEFLRKMLSGDNAVGFLNEKKLMLSIVAERINEKLFDMFGDTVIDFDGDEAILTEDYTEDLKGLLEE